MTPSIRQQAAALSLSPAQVCALRKRGMPPDIEAAKAWRKFNIPGPRGRPAAKLPELQRDLNETRARVEAKLPDSLNEAERIYRELETACDTATARAAQLTGNTAPAIDELGRRWSVVAADLLKHKLEVVERVQVLRVQAGELMLASEARSIFGAVLQDLRRYAETMPARMSLQCNPTNPKLAELALRDWLDGYFRQVHQADEKAEKI